MLQMIEANWLAFVLALLIGIIVAWWLFGRGSRGAEPRTHRPDVLDEGAAPAQRNQALIDAPSAAAAASVSPTPAATTAASFAGTGPDIMGGIGEIAGAAANSEVADAAPPPPPPLAVEAPADGGDDLLRLKGVGPKLVARLHALGITRFDQIAGWGEADIDRIDAELGPFAGRIRRDNWVEQARFLAAGDKAGFEARFGKL